jgi:[ribosomal protein S5]-alanine N-acetyltransferase
MDIQTERLEIEELSLTDLEELHQLHSLPETDEFNTLGIPATIQTTEFLLIEWIGKQKAVPRTSYIFRIRLIEKNKFIGLIALNLGKPHFKIAEVWYKVHPTWWRQGYATEALKKVIEFGFFNLGLHRIEAGCAVENIASIKTLEKAGMIREGSKREVLPIRGKWVDNYFYSILEKDLKPSR